ncbi:MAG: IMPACT family protein [Candidatus Aminicenantes bacterium]|nr:IMPACT family protein [Candidatus Aminicenantes bacterium]
MRTISREAEIVTEIKRSRFIGRSFLQSTPDEALALIIKLRQAERDATHHCWAYRLGREGEQARYSDDGEPRGTAGPPILEVLKKNDVTNVVLVVTRYYGGIKLGTGGLARAYGDAAKRVLEESRLKDLRLTADIEAAVPYPLLGALENYLAGEGGEITGKTFGEFVRVRLRLPADREADFEEYYARLTAGKSSLTVLGRDYR